VTDWLDPESPDSNATSARHSHGYAHRRGPRRGCFRDRRASSRCRRANRLHEMALRSVTPTSAYQPVHPARRAPFRPGGLNVPSSTRARLPGQSPALAARHDETTMGDLLRSEAAQPACGRLSTGVGPPVECVACIQDQGGCRNSTRRWITTCAGVTESRISAAPGRRRPPSTELSRSGCRRSGDPDD